MAGIGNEYFETPWIEVPGVGAGSAYADLDMFGVEFQVDTPDLWWLTEVDLWDKDDEGSLMRVWIATSSMGVTSSDNGALVIPDTSLGAVRGKPISISSYGDANTGQIGSAENLDRLMRTPRGLYVQLQSGGTPNIAAGSVPKVKFIGLK